MPTGGGGTFSARVSSQPTALGASTTGIVSAVREDLWQLVLEQFPEDYLVPSDPFVMTIEGAYYVLARHRLPDADGDQDPFSIISLTIEGAVEDLLFEYTGRPQNARQLAEQLVYTGA